MSLMISNKKKIFIGEILFLHDLDNFEYNLEYYRDEMNQHYQNNSVTK